MLNTAAYSDKAEVSAVCHAFIVAVVDLHLKHATKRH
jgi:hypothetical protein